VFENTKGIIRRRIPKKDRQEEFEDTNEVISGRTPTNDRQEEFEDAKGVIRTVHQRMIYTKSLNLQEE
jgi:hypothetical protein